MSRLCFCLFVVCSVAACTGCGCGPISQASNLQAENRRLAEQSKAQLAEIDNLKVHTREVEDRLLKTERDLESLEAQSGVERKKAANLRQERERLRQNLVAGDAGGGAAPTPMSRSLAELARRYPNLQYDSQTGIAKLNTDILFDSGESQLKPAAQKLLRELAAMLDSPAGKDLHVMVVGHTDGRNIRGAESRDLFPNNWHLSTARANAVADELRKLGLKGDRMGVAGFGSSQAIASNETPTARQRNRRVEIFITAPDVPIVGMTETMLNLY